MAIEAMELCEPRVFFSASRSNYFVNYPAKTPDGAEFACNADFNLDGRQDLAFSSYNGKSIIVRSNQGKNRWSDTVIPLSVAPDHVVAKDTNRDGFQDLIVTQYNSGTVSTILNHNGAFDADETPLTTSASSGSRASIVADFDGDGRLDIVFAKSFKKTLTFLKGNGDGTFQPPANTSLPFTPTDGSSADFDGDGLADVAYSDYFQDKAYVLLGNGDGTFSVNATIPIGDRPAAITAGDFNRDGRADLVTSNLSGPATVIANTPKGYQTSTLATSKGCTFAQISDVSNDGHKDLIFANPDGDKIQIFAGHSNGTFSLWRSYALGYHFIPRAIVIADVNADRLVDFVVTSEATEACAVFCSTQALPPVS